MRNKIYFIGFICLLIDQFSKFLITVFFKPFTGKIIIKNLFEIMFVKNTGAAWGILSNNLFILVFISIVALYILNNYIRKEDSITKFMVLSYSFLLGGITGNLIDRVVRGYVVDFIHIYIFKYSYPVFNIADCFIVVGILLMLIEMVRSEASVYRSRRGRI